MRSQASGVFGARHLAGARQRGLDAPLRARRQVLPDDRVIQHGGQASRAGGEAGIDPVGGIGLLDAGAVACRVIERGIEARETCLLVGPDIGAKTQPVVRVGRIERPPIAAAACPYRNGSERRQRPAPFRLEPKRCRGRSPCGLAEAIGIAVPMQVQPRARADLEQGQGCARLACDGQEPAEQHGAARHLVGLRRAFEKAQHRRRMRLEGVCRRRPQSIGVGRDLGARVDPRQRRRRPRQHQGMQAARETQCQRIRLGIAEPPQDSLAERARAVEPFGRRLEQHRRERRAELTAGRGLILKVLPDRLHVGYLDLAHARTMPPCCAAR